MAEGLSTSEISGLLAAWPHRTPEAEGRLMDGVQGELRRIAADCMRRERSDWLQPTALVNEAYIRLVNQQRRWSGRARYWLGSRMRGR